MLELNLTCSVPIRYVIRSKFHKAIHRLLSVTFVESSEDLLKALRAELLHPTQRIVGERDPERLDASVDLIDA